MRVVAGDARGLRLVAPAGQKTRPTPDRVRESVFNSLGSLGAIEDAVVLDLFAGTGALGIEALSRGAARAVFVESDRAARGAIATNLATTKLADRALVVGADAFDYLASAGESFDLALADPPYDFDRWDELYAAVDAALIVVESNRPIAPAGGWELARTRAYGTTVVTISRRCPQEPLP
jgi:16S rRNA (guanine966-N2)-methyltransferase